MEAFTISSPRIRRECSGDSSVWRSIAEFTIVILVFALPCATEAADDLRISKSSPPPSNILLIIADDVGVDYISAYGSIQGAAKTPHIDSLRDRGILFRSVWANPVCSSTRATILTGRYGFRTGLRWVVDDGADLGDREYTLPELLAEHPRRGYHTAAFGKWHLSAGDPLQPSQRELAGPVRAGFDYFFGSFQNLVGEYSRWKQLEVMDLGSMDPLIRYREYNTRYNTSEIVDRAAQWIRASEANHPSDPWFVWLAFNAAHEPYHKPPSELHGVDLSSAEIDCDNPYPYEEPERVVPCYRAMVEAMDTEIGRLLDSELSEETLGRTTVIFIGDNGTSKEATLADREPMHAKGTPYEAGVRVPLIISGAGVAEAARRSDSDALVNSTDLFATVLELAGLDVAASVPAAFAADVPGQPGEPVVLDSVSLLPLLRGDRTGAKREFVYAELDSAGRGHPVWPEARAVRDRSGYKLIRFVDQAYITAHDELYWLPDDPTERIDLVSETMSPEHREAYDALAARLDALVPTDSRLREPPR